MQLSFGRIYNKLLDLIESARLEDCLLEINNKKNSNNEIRADTRQLFTF